MKKIIIRLVFLGLMLSAAWWGYGYFKQMPQRQTTVPTAKVRQGDVVVRSYARGELRAVRSVTLTAPNLFGTVQVTKLAEMGSLAHEKSLIMEFDDAELQSRLEEKQLEIDQIDEQFKKAEADLAIRSNQDQVELLSARYSVRRAELEVKRNELLSEIDRKRNELNLEESKRRLQQLESDIKSRREQAQAELAVLKERRKKSVLELDREKSRLNQVKVLSPISGLVAVKQNNSSRMGFGFDVPDIREGDQVQPGMPIADVLDLSELEVMARIGELDRANLNENQDVFIELDAIANKRFKGKIKTMSNTASASVFSNDPAKRFDVTFSVEMKDLLSALGAKPETIAQVLAQAAANRHKAPPQTAASLLSQIAGGAIPGMPGMPGGGGMPGADAGGMPGGPGLLTPPGDNADRKGGGARKAGRKQEEKKGDAPTAGKPVDGAKPGTVAGAKPEAGDRKRRGNREGGDAPARGSGGFSQQDIDNAKLPPPPDQDSNLDVLLRPGLLADVEIIIDKIPNAIHVPAQAVFEIDNKMVVYVRNPVTGKFDVREIKLAKRSESTMVIASGLKVDEIIALADPTAKPGSKKDEEKKGGAMSSLPGGKQ